MTTTGTTTGTAAGTTTGTTSKAPTGVAGFDSVTRGGLPHGRATLVQGGPGSGKTVFALQSLVNGARDHGEPGVFVAFEESAERIAANAGAFGWNVNDLQGNLLYFLDARPKPGLIQSGAFDLGGLLAALDAKVAAMGAKRIVFDAVDVVLALMTDPQAMRREIYALHEWLLAKGLTALITAKTSPEGSAAPGAAGAVSLDFMQFMVDCAVELRHDVVDGVSQRNLRVSKYRGSSFEENVTPFVIGSRGIEVAFFRHYDKPVEAAAGEQVSSGLGRLDAMLDGGYYRGASVLLTGSPGTAKTTLCGAFAEAACARGESTLFVSFDSRGDEIVRNLGSVAIRLQPHIDSGLLHVDSARGARGSAEIHLMRIKELAETHAARCLVVDPLSALAKSGNHGVSRSVAERLIDWAKDNDVTLVCTSLLDHPAVQAEGTPMQISTIADTWIHLSYVVQAGERNRGVSIIKSRGAGHSNQVRELVLSDQGLALTDVYTADGEVLMGAMRWQKERAEWLMHEARLDASARERQKLDAEARALEADIERLRAGLALNRAERESLNREEREREEELVDADASIRHLRGADA